MKLLMTTDTVGGVWTYAIDLCEALAAHNVETTLVTMGDLLTPHQRQAADAIPKLRIIETNCRLEWMADPWDDVSRAGEILLEAALLNRPDVVHLNGFMHASLPWEALDLPVLTVGHSCVETWWRAVKGASSGDDWQRYRDAVREGIHNADLFIAPTRAILDAFSAAYGEHSDARVIHNGRNSFLYRRGQTSSKQPIVLSAGRLWDEAKNIAALDKAARHIDWPIHVAGAGREPGTESDDVASDAGETGVHCLGPLPPDRLADQMRRAAIYALPARYEPFGLSALEAGLSGCALVLGDIPTLREVWGDAAVYADPDDPQALARAINGLIADKRRRAQLVTAAQLRARRYTPARMAEAYLIAYRDLVRVHATADTALQGAIA